MRSALREMAQRVQRLDDIRSMEMQRLYEAGGRLWRDLREAHSALGDAEEYMADLEMELVLHGLGVAGKSSTGFVGRAQADLLRAPIRSLATRRRLVFGGNHGGGAKTSRFRLNVESGGGGYSHARIRWRVIPTLAP